MPLSPLTVTLSDGQKIEAMKRLRTRYAGQLAEVEEQLVQILTSLQEAEFLSQYVGDQPEIVELRQRQGDCDKLEKRRAYLAALIERLDAYTPKQAEVKPSLGGEASRPAPGQAGKPTSFRRY